MMSAPKFVTIDSQHTRDMDDGIWVEKTEDHWRILVVVADAASAVPVGGELDDQAKSMVVTRYMPTTTLPMLTRDLSEDLLSLRPNVDRQVIAIEIKLTLALELVSCRPSLMTGRSAAKLAYEWIPDTLTDPKRPWCSLLRDCERLAMALLEKRRSRGAMAIYDLNHGWATTEEGHIRQLESHERTVGYIIVQELMILANGALAEYAVENNIPVLFRNHVASNAAPDRQDLVKQLNDAIHTPVQDLAALRQRTHLLLSRATYEPTLSGHYGLNLPAYMHFTSPIRRYPDLVNHRQLRAALTGEALPYTGEQLAEIGAHCTQVMRELRDSKAEHMKNRADQRAQRTIERGRMRHLNDKELERVTKIEARSGQDATDGLLDEFEHRLQQGTLPLICAAIVFVEAPYFDTHPSWAKIREAVVRALVAKPENAVSILMLAGQMGGPETTYQEATISLVPPVFQATARHGTHDGTGTAATKKLAKQWAATQLLASYTTLKVEAPVVPLPTAPEPAKPVTAGKDPISALQEWTQANRVAGPSYTFDVTGASNTPTFTCRCECSGVAAEGKAASKQEAKREAAKAVLRALLESPHDPHLRPRAATD